ncbi:MAG TPA: 1,4-alpha-glucan branching protein domain-containing protein [Chthoniobacterales bacterium]
MRKGFVALVLHAHLPFVRHPEHDEAFEEDWLFEALTESYIPLLRMMQRLVADAVPFKLTMSVTPPLCAMLQDELLRARYVRHLDGVIDLARRECERNRDRAELQDLAQFYFNLLTDTRAFFEERQRDLLAVFRELRDAGVLEIIACAATHGLLPLLARSAQAVRAQVLVGRDAYREAFGAEPAGFWLPECAYSPALERVLQEANIRWFALDSHGLLLATPRPRASVYAPCFTPAGPAAFARDPASSRQVWSAEAGYPGDPAYREFYRDLGFDLPPAEAFPHSTDQTPRFTGLKFHRITGGSGPKQIYNRAWAANAVEAHAEDFVQTRRAQIRELHALVAEPIVVAPFDAELFGHWWFEGPAFLESVMRKIAQMPGELELTTPAEFLARHQTLEVVTPAASSWGEGGYWGVWLHENNSWVYPHLHAAAKRMTEMARQHADAPSPLVERALKQLARELLLAQSSDWAFLMKTKTAPHYATKRTNDHIARFNRLYEQLKTGALDEAFLSECEVRDNLFPHLDWRYYV